jgi:NADH-quinone oxidoreductase subunit L
VLTFHGPKRWTEDIEHPHESPPVMTIPLILLAFGSVASGWLLSTSVPEWLTPVFEGSHEEQAAGHLSHAAITWLAIGVTVVGALGAWLLFRRGTSPVEEPAGPLVRAARRNLYGDAFNETVFEKPGTYLTRALVYFDNKGLDGLVNGLAALVGGSSSRLKRAQTGFVRSYALSMLGGALLVAIAFLVVHLG